MTLRQRRRTAQTTDCEVDDAFFNTGSVRPEPGPLRHPRRAQVPGGARRLEVGVRQWVLSLPFQVRWLLARRSPLRRAMLKIFPRAILSFAARSGHSPFPCID
jgi:hypothetical protein